jgi:hypothetical protein
MPLTILAEGPTSTGTESVPDRRAEIARVALNPVGCDRPPIRMRRIFLHLADLYALPIIHWSVIEDRLSAGVSQAPRTGGPDRHTCWLATINRDGSPHVTGVGAVWFEAAFWFETGEQTRK